MRQVPVDSVFSLFQAQDSAVGPPLPEFEPTLSLLTDSKGRVCNLEGEFDG